MKKIMVLMFILFLAGSVSASEIFFDGFESGGLGGWGLSHASGANDWTASTTNPYQGSYHSQSLPQSTSEPASVIEKTISTSGYSDIKLIYYRKLVGLDAADEFKAKWYNGATWTILEETLSNAADDADYAYKEFALPSSANDNVNFALKFECTAGAVSEYCRVDNVNITGTIIDITPPQFSNYIENPANNSAYVSNQVYRFNVTVTETNINKVWIEWQGINYTNGNISSSGNVYMFNRTNLAAGTYSYKWWANDTNGNINNSGTREYTVNKATPILTKKLNNQDNNLSIIYPQQVNASGSASAGTLTIYRDGNVIIPEQNYSLSAGYYKFDFNITGNQNYSDLSSSLYANVSKASGQASLLLNGNANNLTIVYPQQSNITASTLYGIIVIYKNGEDITSNNSKNIIRDAGYYNITAVSSGNENYSLMSMTYWLNVSLDLIAPVISIVLPESKTYSYNSSIPLNYSVSDESGVDSCWYDVTNSTSTIINETITNCNNLTFNLPRDGAYALSVYANDTRGNIGSAVRSFSVNTQLAVSLVNPENNKWINHREIEFNYTVNTAGIVNSCSLWGNFNGVWSLNQTNSSAINITGGINKFNLNLSDGSYIWNVYCSGTYNSFALNNYTLNVDLQQPVLSIISPANNTIFKQNVSIPFNFSVSDANLQACWYSLTNGGINYSVNCLNGNNNLSFGYAAGNYNLTIWANDSADNPAYFTSYNLIIEYDNISPSLIINEPKGTKTSLTGIQLQFSVSDNDAVKECWYNFTSLDGTIVKTNTAILNCQNTSFDVSVSTNYVLYLSAKDIAGNINITNSSFTVSTAGTVTPPGDAGGGGGGSFAGNATKKQTSKIEISSIQNMIVNPGESKRVTVNIRNTGTSFLNGCRIIGTGENSGWISSEGTRNIGNGEIAEFSIGLKIPESLQPGSYNIGLSAECQETSQETSFSVEIIEKMLGIDILDAKRDGKEKIKIVYSLAELSNQEQEVQIAIIGMDGSGKKLFESKETRVLGAGEKQTYETIIETDFSGSGISVLINANSGVSSVFVQKEVILGNPPLTGLASLAPSELGGPAIIVLVIILGLFAFFIVRRIIKFRKMAGLKIVKEKGYVKLSEKLKSKK